MRAEGIARVRHPCRATGITVTTQRKVGRGATPTDSRVSPRIARKKSASDRAQPTPANGVYAGQSLSDPIPSTADPRTRGSSSTTTSRPLRLLACDETRRRSRQLPTSPHEPPAPAPRRRVRTRPRAVPGVRMTRRAACAVRSRPTESWRATSRHCPADRDPDRARRGQCALLRAGLPHRARSGLALGMAPGDSGWCPARRPPGGHDPAHRSRSLNFLRRRSRSSDLDTSGAVVASPPCHHAVVRSVGGCT